MWNGAVAGTGDQTDIEVDPKRDLGTTLVIGASGQRAAEGTWITNIRLDRKPPRASVLGLRAWRWRPTIFQSYVLDPHHHEWAGV